MMKNRLDDRSKLYYPPLTESKSNRKNVKLYNDIVSMMESRKFGFQSKKTADEEGKAITLALRDALWYVLPHLSKMKVVCGKFPEFFTFLLTDSVLLTQDYNHPETHRHTARLERSGLEDHIKDLGDIALNPLMSGAQFAVMSSGVKDLKKWINSYAEHLEKTNTNMNTLHKMLSEDRITEKTKIFHVPGQVREDPGQYAELEKALSTEYQEIDIAEFLPTDSRKRYNFITKMAMPFPIGRVSYPMSGSHHSMHFVWRSEEKPDIAKEHEVIKRIEKQLPVFHTRAMRRQFQEEISLLTNTKGTAAITIYQKLTGDSSVLEDPNSRKIQQRMRLIIDTQDPELIADMRLLNKGRPEEFEEFWKVAQALINEAELKAVDDRRLGTYTHMAVAMSVRDFKAKVVEKLPEGVKIPSDQTVYYGFEPANRFNASAEYHTGKLKLKLQMQKRQINQYHPDAHYAAALFQYFKEYAVMYRNVTTLLCVDDKALIPLGEPGVPLSTTPRAKSAVVVSTVPMMSADHDTDTKVKVTPSTTLVVEIPKEATETFCRGQVVSTLKNTIVQPSNPLRHAAEMRAALSKEERENPVRMIYSDGGCDHNIVHPAVQLSLLAMFLMDDLDALVAARCGPGRSYTNPAEKPHCIMNLGLQSITLCRDEMPPGFETRMKKLKSMKEIRTEVQSDPQFEKELLKSVQSCHQMIASQFERLSLKDKEFVVNQPATDDALATLWSFLTNIDPELKQV